MTDFAPDFGTGDNAAFNDRVFRFNRKANAARKRALLSDSKANRIAFGTPSANAVFILDENAGDFDGLGKVLKMADAFGLDLVTLGIGEAA